MSATGQAEEIAPPDLKQDMSTQLSSHGNAAPQFAEPRDDSFTRSMSAAKGEAETRVQTRVGLRVTHLGLLT